MATKRHSYVEFYTSDWIAGTTFMKTSAEWLYLQICIYNWEKCEALPLNLQETRFGRSRTWKKDLESLVACGKVKKTPAGDLFVERAIDTGKKAYDLWERKSRGGRNRHARDDCQDTCSTPAKTPAGNQTQIQTQNPNHSHLMGDSPPDPPGSPEAISIPKDAIEAFRDHRLTMKAALSRKAEELIIRELQKIHEEHGHNPKAVIEQSIANGWRGVFPLKDNRNGYDYRNSARPRDARTGLERAIDRRLDEFGPDGSESSAGTPRRPAAGSG